jgi:predicted metal-dependent peptidase
MVEFAPSTGGLALWVHHVDVPAADADAPAVATDGHSIRYGRAFEALPLAVQVGLVAHEVLHIALRHTQRHGELQQLLGDVDLKLYTVCADAIVNSALNHLSWLQLPAGSVLLDRLLRQTLAIDEPVEKSLLQWDVESLYRALDDRLPASGGKRSAVSKQAGKAGAANQRQDGPRSQRAKDVGAGAQADLLPTPGVPSAPEDEAELARSWSQRILRAHSGDGAHSMLRVLVADLPRVRTPWEQVLRRQLARSLAPEPALSWSRPSRSYLANQGRAGPGRRLPFEPGISASRAVPRLVVVVDTSGSIDAPLMTRFAREIESIARRLGAGLVLVLGDERVQSVQSFAPGRCSLADIAFQGGGGTDFTPLLQEAERHAPDITVVLTDLDGPARHRPRCPVLWAVPETHARAVPPFGRVLLLH